MKHLIIGALALATALPALPAHAQDATTLTLWTRLNEDAGKPMFDAFAKAHPEIKLEV